MTITVEIPFKAKLEFQDIQVRVRGSKKLMDQIQKLKSQYGAHPKAWPLQKVQTGEDILVNEFILKIKGEFSFCYKHEELCHCRNVMTEKVFTVIKDSCFKVEDVSRTTQAGTGCGSCRKDIEALIQQFKVA